MIFSLLVALLLAGSPASGKFAKLDELKVHYQSFGQGKEAVVFIHGWTCDLTFWQAQAPVYEKRRALLIDLPGHGKSDKPEIPYTQELFARAVAAVMRDAGVERATLVGHSMGTPVALTFLRLYPKQVSALVFVDGMIPAAPADDAAKKRQAEQSAAFVKMYRDPNYKESMTRMVDSMFSARTTEAVKQQIRGAMLAAPQHVVASAMEGMMALRHLGAAEVWPDVPVLSVVAKRPNRPGPPPHVKAAFPKLQYEEMDGVGHFLMSDDPAGFNNLLARFLDKK